MEPLNLHIEIPSNIAFEIQMLEGCRQLLFYQQAGGVGRRLTVEEVRRITLYLNLENEERRIPATDQYGQMIQREEPL